MDLGEMVWGRMDCVDLAEDRGRWHGTVNTVWNPLFYFGATALNGPWPPHTRGFQITHIEGPQSVGLLWTSDQPVADTPT